MVGETATLHAPATIASRETLTWKCPRGTDVKPGGRFHIHEGGAKLSIANCEITDSGEYICTAKSSNVTGSVNSSTRTVRLVLEVSRLPVPPPQPKVQDLKGTSAVLTWEAPGLGAAGSGDRLVRVEACRLAIGNLLIQIIYFFKLSLKNTSIW